MKRCLHLDFSFHHDLLHRKPEQPLQPPLQDWVVYCSTVVLSALEACGVEAPDERKNLLSIGLAARTFNFSGNPVTKNLKCAETIQGAASYNCTEIAVEVQPQILSKHL